jgi:hypothetical protein
MFLKYEKGKIKKIKTHWSVIFQEEIKKEWLMGWKESESLFSVV